MFTKKWSYSFAISNIVDDKVRYDSAILEMWFWEWPGSKEKIQTAKEQILYHYLEDLEFISVEEKK